MGDESVALFSEGYFRWRSRRGMKELDFVLNRYLDSHYHLMNEETKKQYDALLGTEDMTLWYWFSGKQVPKDSGTAQLVKTICEAGYLKK